MLVFVCSPDNDLYRVVSAEGEKCLHFVSIMQMLNQTPEGSGVLILADGYPQTTTDFPNDFWELAQEKQLRLYIEYPTAVPGVELGRPVFSKTGPFGSIVERIVVTSHVFGPELERMSILSSWNCHYLPVTIENPHMVLAHVAGYDKAVLGLPEQVHPLFFEAVEGRILVSTTKLSNMITARPGPQAAWRRVWQMILGWLEPNVSWRLEWEPLVRSAYGPDEILPAQAETELMKWAGRWIVDSRLLVHPSDERHLKSLYEAPLALPDDWQVGNGSRGILESYSPKQIFLDGRQPVGGTIRTDSVCQSAMVAAFCGQLLENKTYTDIATNLLDFTFFHSELFANPSPQADDPLDGLLRWCTQPNASSLFFSDDNARSILGALAAGAALNTDRWEEAILTAILADLRTTGRKGFRPNKCLERDDVLRYGWRYYWEYDGIDLYAHFHATIWSVFLWLYDKTGFLPLLERARCGLTEMMTRDHGQWKAEGGRLDSEYAHLLLPLAWLVRVDDCEQHRAWLDRVARFLIDHQDPCGAIYQVVANQESTEIRPEQRRIIVHPLGKNEEYGQEEVPIVYQTGDPGTDLLYTLNFAFLGMHEAARATGNSNYARSAERMADFLIRVQTRSEARPELSGTWYRGFDFKRWDYWGSDGDWGYGVLTTQTGWTHSLITATFALRQWDTSLWDLTKSSTIGRRFQAIRSRMIPDEAILTERKSS
jgi:hypothetical protein